MCSSPSMPPSTLILLPASGGASRVRRRPSTWGPTFSLPIRQGATWAHLPLPRVPPTRGLPSAQLRPAAAPQWRSPDRDSEPNARQRSAHRPVATHRCTLYRADGYALGCSAKIRSNPDSISSCGDLPHVTPTGAGRSPSIALRDRMADRDRTSQHSQVFVSCVVASAQVSNGTGRVFGAAAIPPAAGGH
jgi:hypothetical protein